MLGLKLTLVHLLVGFLFSLRNPPHMNILGNNHGLSGQLFVTRKYRYRM